MKNFFEKTTYTETDVLNLIQSQAEESIHLDFKSRGALEKSDRKKSEIGKDVSAFANSDGGVIIYGLIEDNHIASSLDYIDGSDFTKEWLEQVIYTQVSPKIEDIHIIPIRFNNELKKSIYIVKIPRSKRVPHMANGDKRYYKRYNFQSVPMEEYEVRTLFEKVHESELDIMDLLLESSGGSVSASVTLNTVGFKVTFQIQNVGNSIEHHYKFEIQVPKGLINLNRNSIQENFVRHESGLSIFRFGNSFPIFQNEVATALILELDLNPTNYRLLQQGFNCLIYYSNGKKERRFDIIPLLKYQEKSLADWGWHI